jgi:thioredoxin reductase (NADPH)
MYDVLIIGSGPAGLTAAIYTTRADLKTLIIGGLKWGGQLMLTSKVENYPGFPDGILGPDLMELMKKQAVRFGGEFLQEDITSVDFSRRPFTVQVGDKKYQGKSVIIATGADTKWLGVPGEEKLIGRGVSSCATCDAAFFRGKDVITVGGGDTAMEDSIFLTNFAKSVTIVHRRDEFRASHIMLERAKKNPKIKFITNTEVKEIKGENKVESVVLFDNKTNKTEDMPIEGVFVAIGHIPNSKVFAGIDVDQKGYIKVHDHYLTNIEGVFVAGDVHDYHYKQAVTAAGYGCAAALEAERWLRRDE